MEKTGFIYIWYDAKRKMYYIGCHWGTEDDGYICSSHRMLNAYNKRPKDFKRRIIERNIDRENLFEIEHKWLSFIKEDEYGDRYYNLITNHINHWTGSADENKRLSISEKISRTKTGKKHNLTPEQSTERGKRIAEAKQKKKEERLALGLPVRKKEKNSRPLRGPESEETKHKKSETMKQKIKSGEWKPWSTGIKTGPRSEETKQKIRNAVSGKTRTNEQKKNISEANKASWSSGKYSNRKSNNMKDFIWVTNIETGNRTRIRKETFDSRVYRLGKV